MPKLFIGNGATVKVTPNLTIMRDKKTYQIILTYNGERLVKSIRSTTFKKLLDFADLSDSEFEEKVADIVFKKRVKFSSTSSVRSTKSSSNKIDNSVSNLISEIKSKVMGILSKKGIVVEVIEELSIHNNKIEVFARNGDMEISITIVK